VVVITVTNSQTLNGWERLKYLVMILIFEYFII